MALRFSSAPASASAAAMAMESQPFGPSIFDSKPNEDLAHMMQFGGVWYSVKSGQKFTPDGELLEEIQTVLDCPSDVYALLDEVSNVLCQDGKFYSPTGRAFIAYAVQSMLSLADTGVNRRTSSISDAYRGNVGPNETDRSSNFFTKSCDVAYQFPDLAHIIVHSFFLAHAKLVKEMQKAERAERAEE